MVIESDEIKSYCFMILKEGTNRLSYETFRFTLLLLYILES